MDLISRADMEVLFYMFQQCFIVSGTEWHVSSILYCNLINIGATKFMPLNV